jgi:hypothetical protein
MTKYRVWLPEQTRIIEADDEDEAISLFVIRDDLFDFLEAEEISEQEASQRPEEAPGR